jgi:predicted metalloprotease with PDZ domain
MFRITLNLALLVTLIASSVASAQNSGPSYEVDLSDSLNHYVTVTMIADATGDETEIMMATWTPGSYLVREYAKHVDRIEARTTRGRGKVMPLEKISKNRWRIDTSGAKKFKVTYRIYCNTLSVRTNFVGQSYAVLNGAPTFITVPEQLDQPHQVSLSLPDKWKRSATSMAASGDQSHSYMAKNYDELVDSPIVAGNVSIYPFKVDGVEHSLVNVNESGVWDGDKSARDLAKVVRAHHELWGNIPYDRYMFINVIGGGGGGLEHDNCCLMMSSRWSFRSDSGYIRWLSLASHEFFHTWNIRRLRPKALVNYDYENEVYTPSLWVAEGITSYYEDLLLVRAGLMSEDEFLGTFGGSVSRVQRNKGRKVQSLRDSSHDAWIKFYRPERNSSDTTVSYYTKGSVVAFLLDAQIRKESGGQRSLDDVLRKLYTEHANPVGYLPSDFRRICSEMAGTDMSDWFASAVDSTDELDWQDLSNWYGFQIGDVKPLKAGEKPAEPRTPRASRTRWIGVGESESPASKAGLADSDEILAVNNLRLSGSVDSRIQDFDIGDAVTLLISREDKIMELAVTIGSRMPTPSWGMSKFKKATEEQELHLEQWLQGITVESPDQEEPAEEASDEKEMKDDSDDQKKSESDKDPFGSKEDSAAKSPSESKKQLSLKVAGKSNVKVNANLSARVEITNNSSTDMSGLTVTNSFNSVQPTSVTAKYKSAWQGNDFVIQVGDLKAGESATIEIVYVANKVDAEGSASFAVTAEGGQAAESQLTFEINE